MKIIIILTSLLAICLFSTDLIAQQPKPDKAAATKTFQPPKHLYLDVHHIGPGKITANDVATAHDKDLQVQEKYGVSFLRYWVDEANGNIYCLAEAADSLSVRKTHKESHGLMPDRVHMVTAGEQEAMKGKRDLYLDLHVIGEGKVSAAGVEGAHQKDLAVQQKHGVNFINYWVDEKTGTIICLAQAPNADSLINSHKEAHGLLPIKVNKVKEGH